MLVHLDTDLAGDPDDVAALVYLLARDDVELTGITTVDDPGGRRAGYVAEVLRLAGRQDVPLAAGAEVSLTTGQPSGGPPPGPPYWPAEAAAAARGRSTRRWTCSRPRSRPAPSWSGIGPATTLALLERRSPGGCATAHVVLMGGWVEPPAAGPAAVGAGGRLERHLRRRWPPPRCVLQPAGSPSYRSLRPRRCTCATATCRGWRRAGPLGRPDGPAGDGLPGRPGQDARWRGPTPACPTTSRTSTTTRSPRRWRPAGTGSRSSTRSCARSWPSTAGWSAPGRTIPVPGRVELVVGVDGPAFAAHWLDTVTAGRVGG